MHLKKYRRLFGSADYNNASGVLRDTMVRVVNEDLESYLPDIRYPVLLIWGDQDDATPMRGRAYYGKNDTGCRTCRH